MSSMSTDKAKNDFSKVVERAAREKERVVLTRKGKKVAAVVPIEDLKLLEELDDRQDVADAKKALAEPGPNIPWEQIKKKQKI